RVLEAPVDRVIRELPCGERHGTLAVLDAGEALLLRRGDHVPVLDATGGRIVISGVDAERMQPFPGSASLRALRADPSSKRRSASVVPSCGAFSLDRRSTVRNRCPRKIGVEDRENRCQTPFPRKMEKWCQTPFFRDAMPGICSEKLVSDTF